MYWFLAGEIEDTQSGPYKIPGTKTKNTESIKAAERTIPGLSQYLTNPLEFVEWSFFRILVKVMEMGYVLYRRESRAV